LAIGRGWGQRGLGLVLRTLLADHTGQMSVVPPPAKRNHRLMKRVSRYEPLRANQNGMEAGQDRRRDTCQ